MLKNQKSISKAGQLYIVCDSCKRHAQVLELSRSYKQRRIDYKMALERRLSVIYKINLV